MGVKQLWKLLEPVGRPVLLETMEGKALAIDSSIWIYQFQATMRDRDGRGLHNAHLLGFLRRICKLLFYGIKPVFVFDGGAPTIKKATIAERKRRKAGASHSHAKVAERLLAAQLRREAVIQAQAHGTTKPRDNVILDENTVYFEDLEGPGVSTPQKPKQQGENHTTEEEAKQASAKKKANKWRDHDPYKLPDLDLGAAIAEAASNRALNGDTKVPDPRLATEDELRAFIETMRPEDFDASSPAFRELPTEIQYEIIGDLRLKSRQTSHKRLQEMLRGSKSALDFSKAQIRGLHNRNKLTQQLLDTTDNMGKMIVDHHVRIVAERSKEYVLVKNEDAATGGWILSFRDEGTQEKPIQVQPDSDDDDDMEEVTPQIPTTEVSVFDMSRYQSRMALASIGRSQGTGTVPLPKVEKQPSKTPEVEPLFGFPEDIDSDHIDDEDDVLIHAALRESLEDTATQQLMQVDAHGDDNDEELQQALAASIADATRDINPPSPPITSEWEPGDLYDVPKPAAAKSLTPPVTVNSTPDTPLNISSLSYTFRLNTSVFAAEEPDVSQTSKPSAQETAPVTITRAVPIASSPVKKSVEFVEPKPVPTPIPIPTPRSIPALEAPRPIVVEDEDDDEMEEIVVSAPKTPSPKSEVLSIPPIVLEPYQAIKTSKSASVEESPESPQAEPERLEEISEEEVFYSDWSRSPSPSSGRRENKSTFVRENDRNEQEFDAAHEMDPQAEEGDFANFMSQVKGKELSEIRDEIDAEIEELNKVKKTLQRDSEDITQQMVSSIMMLLRLFGIPYITAPMEAEAQCATLVELGLVEGIITDDSDVFLFGGLRVFKNMFNQSKTVEVFLANDLQRELSLDRDKLIRLAYLLGSDYVDGLPGVGPVVAMELLKEFPGQEGLYRFRDWWTKVQTGKDKPEDVGTSFRRRFKRRFKTLHLMGDWPNPTVRDAYYHPTVDESEDPFKWGLPDLDGLRSYLNEELGWGQSKTDDLLLPIIKKMGQRTMNAATKRQGILDNYFDTSVGSGTYAPRKRQAYTSKRLQQVVTEFRKNQAESKSRSATPTQTENTDASEGISQTTRGGRKRTRGAKATSVPRKKRRVRVSSPEDDEEAEGEIAEKQAASIPDRPLNANLRPRRTASNQTKSLEEE